MPKDQPYGFGLRASSSSQDGVEAPLRLPDPPRADLLL